MLHPEDYEEENEDHNRCREDIKEAITEDRRRNLADKLGENWASIISGCGDQ